MLFKPILVCESEEALFSESIICYKCDSVRCDRDLIQRFFTTAASIATASDVEIYHLLKELPYISFKRLSEDSVTILLEARFNGETLKIDVDVTIPVVIGTQLWQMCRDPAYRSNCDVRQSNAKNPAPFEDAGDVRLPQYIETDASIDVKSYCSWRQSQLCSAKCDSIAFSCPSCDPYNYRPIGCFYHAGRLTHMPNFLFVDPTKIHMNRSSGQLCAYIDNQALEISPDVKLMSDDIQRWCDNFSNYSVYCPTKVFARLIRHCFISVIDSLRKAGFDILNEGRDFTCRSITTDGSLQRLEGNNLRDFLKRFKSRLASKSAELSSNLLVGNVTQAVSRNTQFKTTDMGGQTHESDIFGTNARDAGLARNEKETRHGYFRANSRYLSTSPNNICYQLYSLLHAVKLVSGQVLTNNHQSLHYTMPGFFCVQHTVDSKNAGMHLEMMPGVQLVNRANIVSAPFHRLIQSAIQLLLRYMPTIQKEHCRCNAEPFQFEDYVDVDFPLSLARRCKIDNCLCPETRKPYTMTDRMQNVVEIGHVVPRLDLVFLTVIYQVSRCHDIRYIGNNSESVTPTKPLEHTHNGMCKGLHEGMYGGTCDGICERVCSSNSKFPSDRSSLKVGDGRSSRMSQKLSQCKWANANTTLTPNREFQPLRFILGSRKVIPLDVYFSRSKGVGIMRSVDSCLVDERFALTPLTREWLLSEYGSYWNNLLSPTVDGTVPLFGITASLCTLPNHSSTAKTTAGACGNRHACGIPLTRARRERRQAHKSLLYPQNNTARFGTILDAVQTAVIVISALGGDNVEDGVVVSKRARDFGFGMTETYWTMRATASTMDRGAIALPTKQGRMKHALWLHDVRPGTTADIELDEWYRRRPVREGSLVYEILGNAGTASFDTCIEPITAQTAFRATLCRRFDCAPSESRLYVDAITVSAKNTRPRRKKQRTSLDDAYTITVYFSEVRLLECGDKFSTTDGQKATVVRVAPTEDMPFFGSDNERLPPWGDIYTNISMEKRQTLGYVIGALLVTLKCADPENTDLTLLSGDASVGHHNIVKALRTASSCYSEKCRDSAEIVKSSTDVELADAVLCLVSRAHFLREVPVFDGRTGLPMGRADVLIKDFKRYEQEGSKAAHFTADSDDIPRTSHGNVPVRGRGRLGGFKQSQSDTCNLAASGSCASYFQQLQLQSESADAHDIHSGTLTQSMIDAVNTLEMLGIHTEILC